MATVLNVKRMTKAETIRNCCHRKTIKEENGNWEIPENAPIKWIVQYIGKSDRTIARYRHLLFQNCLEFQTLTCVNGIENSILTKRQIELIRELSQLFDFWKNADFAIKKYNERHPHPTDYQRSDDTRSA